MEEKIISKCPLCGGEIIISNLRQYSYDYKINKNGRISKKYTKNDCGTLECMIANCTDCEAEWSEDDFYINADNFFVDCKYAVNSPSAN